MSRQQRRGGVGAEGMWELERPLAKRYRLRGEQEQAYRMGLL